MIGVLAVLERGEFEIASYNLHHTAFGLEGHNWTVTYRARTSQAIWHLELNLP